MNFLWAFLVGGAICAVGQLLIDLTKLTPARILTTFVVTGVVLGAIGVYEPLADFAGAGATVPLTGFGYLLSKGVKEAVLVDGFSGIVIGPLSAAAGGVTTVLVLALLVALLFKRGDKMT
jgi:stage V sporulation protein AE